MNNSQMHISKTRRFALIFMAAAALMLVPEVALADPATVLCAFAGYAQGNLGKGIATLAVITIGISAAFGRASWTQVVLVSVGISVAVGAATLLSTVGLVSC